MKEEVHENKMEEHNSVSFLRLLSEESTQSSDSYEYYQTEIFDQLPSVQALRPVQAYQGGPELGKRISHGQLPPGPRDKTSTQPLRNLVTCIQGKRGARDRRKMQRSKIGCWESWRRSQNITTKRVWAQMGGALSGLLPWQHTLHTIEGRFGFGVKSYFVFLRYLIYLNLLHCALISGFILGPTAFYGRGNSSGKSAVITDFTKFTTIQCQLDVFLCDLTEPLRFGDNDSVLDFFLGSGYLDRSPVFLGFYTPGSLNKPCLKTPLLYFAGILTILFLSLIMVVRRTIVGYKHTWMLGRRYSTNMSYKIFCGWDFTIQDPIAATLKRSFIRNDLKLFLDEQRFSLREEQRTLGQRVFLYLLRFILNLLILSLLGGAFCLIYYATTKSQEESKRYWLVSLLLQYLPSITITSINLVLPLIFRKISSFEDYSFTAQVNATLVRSIFLKLTSLGIFLFFIFKEPEHSVFQCRQNKFGREMYKLCIFNFLATFCNAFLLNYPRMLVQENFPSSLLARLMGKKRFLITFNVLDLVYLQTVSWVGVFYCPLLPLIGTVTLTASFYIQKFTVLRCCVAEQRMFRGSSSSVLFHFMLLLGLLMAAVTLGLNLHQQEATPDKNLSSCGPFGNGKTVLFVAGECVESLPSLAQSTLRYLASEAFALPLILTEVIILTSFMSRRRANQKAIERLKDMLVMSSSDKRFLVKQHATILRGKRNNHRVRSADIQEDPPSSPTE
ncbi:transmembrane channel-like protein 7 isoform X1 [Labrus mixtus]|uniref:transmembrane channel-like protein 7 isoform X1 n=1 Tax=Labrus mixtus TaxID=508554 RepID=UPI0029BFAA9E|nr:transmembrane channel-like protein 7 isoform X1 [Labrus mixtus]